jgi:hypothetical protein
MERADAEAMVPHPAPPSVRMGAMGSMGAAGGMKGRLGAMGNRLLKKRKGNNEE